MQQFYFVKIFNWIYLYKRKENIKFSVGNNEIIEEYFIKNSYRFIKQANFYEKKCMVNVTWKLKKKKL